MEYREQKVLPDPQPEQARQAQLEALEYKVPQEAGEAQVHAVIQVSQDRPPEQALLEAEEMSEFRAQPVPVEVQEFKARKALPDLMPEQALPVPKAQWEYKVRLEAGEVQEVAATLEYKVTPVLREIPALPALVQRHILKQLL